MPKKPKAEQIPLIDVAPKSAKKLAQLATDYKAIHAERIEAREEEKRLKEKLLTAIKASDVVPDIDGKITLRLDGTIITVTPRDELLRVKFEDEDDGD